jgi:aspartate/glutamate racemase
MAAAADLQQASPWLESCQGFVGVAQSNTAHKMDSQTPFKPMMSIPAIHIPPETLTELQAQYAQELQALWLQGLNDNAP